MSVNPLHLLAILCLFSAIGWAAPSSRSTGRGASTEDLSMLANRFKTVIADLKHDIQNHEAEIRMCEEKLHNQEGAFEELRQQLTEDLQTQRDFSRATSVNLEGKVETLSQSLTNLETLVQGIVTDVRQIKTQANDSIHILAQYKQKFAEIDKCIEAEHRQIQDLETALQSIMDLWQAKSSSRETASGREYKVQPGDSLEKIARTQKVSLQALREVNHLAGDRIIVGQTLKLPPPPP